MECRGCGTTLSLDNSICPLYILYITYFTCVNDGFCAQLFIGAMGPPGGGRNDITARFSRHLQIVSIDEFDETTMMKIFSTISDWHFSKKGFTSAFVRNGKV